MAEPAPLTVVRLGHRPGRDERTTTHVTLVARAFGADEVVIPETASHVSATLADITDRFGGERFTVTEVSNPLRWLEGRDEPIVHLTMYGLPITEVIDEIKTTTHSTPLTVAVGGGKVPGDLYDWATWNVSVTNQPHSEIAALAVFLDRLSDGSALDHDWADADYEIVPTATGKRVEPTHEE